MTIELRDVRKRFGLGQGQQVIAADGISLTIGTGEFVSLTGALRDGAVVDDIQLTEGHPVEDIIRRVGQLG